MGGASVQVCHQASVPGRRLRRRSGRMRGQPHAPLQLAGAHVFPGGARAGAGACVSVRVPAAAGATPAPSASAAATTAAARVPRRKSASAGCPAAPRSPQPGVGGRAGTGELTAGRPGGPRVRRAAGEGRGPRAPGHGRSEWRRGRRPCSRVGRALPEAGGSRPAPHRPRGQRCVACGRAGAGRPWWCAVAGPEALPFPSWVRLCLTGRGSRSFGLVLLSCLDLWGLWVAACWVC